MESVKISPKKCKIAMALAGHHTAALRQRPWVRIPLNYQNFFELICNCLNCNYDYDDHISVADPDLQIRGGGGAPVSKNFFFGPSDLSLV